MTCSTISKTDPTRGLVCRALVAKGVQERTLNSPQSVDAKAIELAVAKSRHNFKGAGDSNFSPKSPWLKFLKEKTNRVIPFIFDNRDVLQKLYQSRHQIRTAEALDNFVTTDLGLK